MILLRWLICFLGSVLTGIKSWPVGLFLPKWLNLAKTVVTAPGKYLVFGSASRFPFDFPVAQRSFNLRGIANQHAAGGAGKTRFNKCSRADQRLGTNDSVVHHHGIHAHQGIAANAAPVQYGSVADMSIFLDNAVFVGEAMHDATVLNIAPPVQEDAPKVATEHCAGADVTVLPDDDIADQNSRRVNIGRFVNNRNQVFNGIVRHVALY